MNHHHPFLADYYTVVLGFSAVILIFLAFFIYFLFVGLKTRDALVVDPLPDKLISGSLEDLDFTSHQHH